jgi:hypothetical protein
MMVGAAGIVAGLEKPAPGALTAASEDPGVFNVMACGAKGDGIADDSDAIQSAIDAAQNYSRGNVSKGGVVFLPTGSYQVSKTLLITQAIKIFGHGQATIDGATHIVPTSLGFDVIKIVNVNWGVVLEGFLIKAYSYHGTGGHFLRIQACQHVRVRGVHLVNCWNGALVDSSGDVFFYDMNVSGADVAGEGRYGIKCTAASKGNPNAAQAINCMVSQWGQNVRTMDGFVLANGYNSFSAINSGALNCNRAYWSTKDGGTPPNFFVVSLGCSDHCNTAVALDDGSFTQFSELVVTSSYVDNINVGENITGPVAFSNCAIFTTGGNRPPHGAGYRITSTKAPSVSITGGSVRDTAGHAIDISGNASVLATGIAISAIQSGKSADGVAVSGSGNVTLAGLSITDIKHTAIRVQPEFTGILTFSGISQHNANRGLFDEGSTGTIVGSGSFRTNSAMDVDVSKNRSAATCIQTHGSIPAPFYPTPAVPKSGSPVQNATGTNCMIYLSRAQIRNVRVDGIDLGVQSAVYIPVNRSIELDYEGTLSWVWQRVT